MRNQRGGIISKVFLIPAGVVVIISVFALGYYVGKNRGEQTAAVEKLPALPEVVSQYLPKKEDFTFYRTLTEKGEKTVSVELKPKQRHEESDQAKKSEEKASGGENRSSKRSETAGTPEKKAEKPPVSLPIQPSVKPQPQAKKNEPTARTAPARLRYTIQVGSYPEKNMAEDEARNMKKRGYAAFVVATDIPDKGKWYRVRIGSFANKQSAEKLAGELKAKESVEGFITAE